MAQKSLIILGTRGIPARHGGFETFAERLALFLVSRGWRVTVYCQEERGGTRRERLWRGVRTLHIAAGSHSFLASVIFDLKAAWHCRKEEGVVLTLGYNTAIFNVLQRLWGQVNLINMDGIEWRRDKWGALAKAWFRLNERAGCMVANHLVVDHPMIGAHLEKRGGSRKMTMIPYGADVVSSADPDDLIELGLDPDSYSLVIARPEPENLVLEIVAAFSAKVRGHKLVVLGNYDSKRNQYHRSVMEAAGPEVVFPGAIYDTRTVQALRFFSRLYLHGHTVGGTNPSLVEAMGAGGAVLAHDNGYNRWVAGPAAAYFKDEASCTAQLDLLLADQQAVQAMKLGSLERFKTRFTWPQVLGEYELLLDQWHADAKAFVPTGHDQDAH